MKEPVVIGMYSGIKKPESSKMYLTDLANELSQLQEGFTFEGKRLTLKVHSMICDAPAKSFVKVTKAFNGYYGCDKCIQSGVYLNHRMSYPLMNSQTRSDEAFARQEDEEHHHGPHAFTNVDFGLVSQVPLDYMHLVCLGVGKAPYLSVDERSSDYPFTRERRGQNIQKSSKLKTPHSFGIC